jgi:nitroreductase
MGIVEAINKRKSIRAFRSDPVPKDVLRKIIGLALRAPSYDNTQPWEFAIATGKKLGEIRQAFVGKAAEATEDNSDIPPTREFPQPYDTGRRTLGRRVLQLKGISREDKGKRMWWLLQRLRLLASSISILTVPSIYRAPS